MLQGEETLILKGGPHPPPCDLQADPMASPWPALACYQLHVVPAASVSQEDKQQAWPGWEGRSPVASRDSARNSASPPPACSLRLWPGHVRLFLGLKQLQPSALLNAYARAVQSPLRSYCLHPAWGTLTLAVRDPVA